MWDVLAILSDINGQKVTKTRFTRGKNKIFCKFMHMKKSLDSKISILK